MWCTFFVIRFATVLMYTTAVSRSDILLACTENVEDANRDRYVYANMTIHHLPKRCPEVYDYQMKLRQHPHMCSASIQPHICKFSLSNVIVTQRGGLFNTKTQSSYLFDHKTMGLLDPVYDYDVHQSWTRYYHEFKRPSASSPASFPMHYDLVVPTRTIWDDCFNHLSFQSMPLIGHIYHFYPELWHNITWHSSIYTAALLRLLDVPLERIVIEKELYAKKILLAWVPGWNPVQMATLYGVSREISDQITAKLLSKFGTPMPTTQNLVLFMSRARNKTRGLVNNDELILLLDKHLNKSYTLVTLPHTDQERSIEVMHRTWYQYANLFSRAKVIIGPHGSAFNNIIWARADVTVIEFNEFPDYPTSALSHGRTAVRPVFLNAAWSRGITGRYYVIEPSKRHFRNFYEGKMRIAPFELFAILRTIPGLLASEEEFVPEEHGIFPIPAKFSNWKNERKTSKSAGKS